MKTATNYICFLQSTDPYENLALEEALFNHIPENTSYILLYVNETSVIVGRHQDPHRETNMERLEQDAIPVIRRMTGGGTVYHDSGNLNYSFIQNGQRFSRKDALAQIHQILKQAGIHTDINENLDLDIEGYKVSGNSFLIRESKHIHHGTLLLNSNLSRLKNYLKTSENYDSEGVKVKSRPRKVKNIKTYYPFIDSRQVWLAFTRYFPDYLPLSDRELYKLFPLDTTYYREKLQSPEWTYQAVYQ